MDFLTYWQQVKVNHKTRRIFDELPVIISALGYALVIGIITFIGDGLDLAFNSLLWQLPYTYLASKIIYYSVKYLAMKVASTFWAYFLAVVLPTLFSLSGTYLVQAYIVRVTHVLPTLLPTLVVTPLACFGWAKVQRLLRKAPTSR